MVKVQQRFAHAIGKIKDAQITARGLARDGKYGMAVEFRAHAAKLLKEEITRAMRRKKSPAQPTIQEMKNDRVAQLKKAVVLSALNGDMQQAEYYTREIKRSNVNWEFLSKMKEKQAREEPLQ